MMNKREGERGGPCRRVRPSRRKGPTRTTAREMPQGSYVGREASGPLRPGARPLGRCGARPSKARELGASKASGAWSAGRGERPDRSGAWFRRSRRHFLERA